MDEMARKKDKDKIISIDQQIQKLQQEREKILNELHLTVGKSVVNEWGINDKDELKKVIKHFKNDVTAFLNTDSETEVSEEHTSTSTSNN